MSEFRDFLKFFSREETLPYAEILKNNNIPFKIAESKPRVDLTFSGSGPIEYWLQVLEDDFEKVSLIFETFNSEQEIDPDYYLMSFSDAELMEIIENFNEWSPADHEMAKQILRKRGKEITEEEIRKLKEQKIKELEKPEYVKKGWLTVGYLIAVLGGFLSVVIGFSILNSYKILPDGRKIERYDVKSRIHGRNILFLGMLFIVIWFIYWIIMV